MPLFKKKLENKPIPPRSARCNHGCPQISEELDDYKQITLCLGNNDLRFVDGVWIHVLHKGDVNELVQLNRSLKTLQKQLNMSKLKMEVIEDLLAENITSMQLTKFIKKT